MPGRHYKFPRRPAIRGSRFSSLRASSLSKNPVPPVSSLRRSQRILTKRLAVPSHGITFAPFLYCSLPLLLPGTPPAQSPPHPPSSGSSDSFVPTLSLSARRLLTVSCDIFTLQYLFDSNLTQQLLQHIKHINKVSQTFASTLSSPFLQSLVSL